MNGSCIVKQKGIIASAVDPAGLGTVGLKEA
jgi:hypothetical protein